MRIYQWGELPACHSRQIRKLEAYATVCNKMPLALDREMSTHSPAESLIERAVAGDRSALEQLLLTHHDRLAGYGPQPV
jgi:hypothetical protein